MERKARLESLFYTHQELWGHAQILRSLAESDKKHETSLGLAALSLLFFAFEGYLNFLIESAFPDVWEQEKEYFRRPPYKGTLGKLAFVREQLEIEVRKGNRMDDSLNRLRKLRHDIVHPKIERREKEIVFTDPRRLKNLESQFLHEVNRKFLERAFRDVKQVCDEIQARAFEQRRKGIYGSLAFPGIASIMGGTIL